MALVPKFSFVAAILGGSGADALRKAVAERPALEAVLLPRTAMAFVSGVSEYEGVIPGLDGSRLRLSKSGDGTYSGSMGVGDLQHAFEGESVYRVAAALSLALGLDRQPALAGQSAGLTKAQVQRLGKTIDLLAKAESVFRVRKTEGAGPAAAPLAPDEPAEAVAPAKQQSPGSVPPKKSVKVRNIPAPLPKVAKPKVPQIPGVKLARSQVESKCPVCRRGHFQADEYSGCLCFQDLSKSAEATVYADGSAYLAFKSDEWDGDTVRTLLESMGGR